MDCGPTGLSLRFFWYIAGGNVASELLDELDVAHRQKLLDHRIGSEHNLSLLHLHRCPAVG